MEGLEEKPLTVASVEVWGFYPFTEGTRGRRTDWLPEGRPVVARAGSTGVEGAELGTIGAKRSSEVSGRKYAMALRTVADLGVELVSSKTTYLTSVS